MTKLPSLQFYLTDWNRSKWIIYFFEDFDNWYSISSAPACYVIYLNDSLSYIGQASNLKERIRNHSIRYSYGSSILTPWGSFDKVMLKARYAEKNGDWAMREIRLISRLQPPLNCVGSIKKRTTT